MDYIFAISLNHQFRHFISHYGVKSVLGLAPDSSIIINKFFSENLPDGSAIVSKVLRDSCLTWFDCVRLARQKFENYFLNKAQRLLHHFPPETETNSGKFWTHPKKVPNTNVVFCPSDPLHLDFVLTFALCWAHLWNVQVSIFELLILTIQSVIVVYF